MGRDGKRTEVDAVDTSDISRKYPTYRTISPITVENWIAGKQKDDESEGLWRVHDKLYDFTDFVEHHPGGEIWLKQTKGTDITEQFEAHHISKTPENMLKKFEIREASQPRNITLTFHENGFYKTLKRRVRDKIKGLDYSPQKRSNLYHLGLLAGTLGLSMGYAVTDSLFVALGAALSLCWLTISAHNYFHQRDNWQMYTFNLSLFNFSAWRISHALSHHAFPNSLHDLELSMFEPFLCWVPNERYATKMRRIISVLTQPIIYVIMFQANFITRVIHSIRGRNVLYWHDLIGFTIPALMWLSASTCILTVMRQWMVVLSLGGVIFAVIAVNGAHHHPKIYHAGDAFRDNRDWGIFQIDTIIDWREVKGSQFLILTHFGEHALHHLFPTLDHGVLPQLYPLLNATMKEFEVELRECNHFEHIIGHNKQLLRTEINPIPTGANCNRS